MYKCVMTGEESVLRRDLNCEKNTFAFHQILAVLRRSMQHARNVIE